MASNQLSSTCPCSYRGGWTSSVVYASNNTSLMFSMMPGAYVYLDGAGSYPIYCSIHNFNANQYAFSNVVDKCIVLPGYMLRGYRNREFDTQTLLLENTTNTLAGPGTFTTTNDMDSVKLYYHDYELTSIGTHGVASDLPCSVTNNLQVVGRVDNEGLAYFYPFTTDKLDYSSGSGSNNAQTAGGTIDTTRCAWSGGAGSLRINSATDTFRLPSHTINTSKGYSVAMWYKLDSMPTANTSNGTLSYARIFEASTALNTNGIFLAYPTFNSLAIQFSPSAGGNINVGYTMDYNWHHIAVTCSITGYWTVYVDGVEREMTLNQTLPTTTALAYWYLGKSVYAVDGNATANFNNLLIMNRELKPYEVYYLYKYPNQGLGGNFYYMPTQINQANLLYYYPLNNTYNNFAATMYPSGGNGTADATTTAGTTFETANKVMNTASLLVNANNGYFQVPAHTIPSTGYTVAFWYKLTTNPGSAARIFEAGPAIGSGGIILYFNTSANNTVWWTVNQTVDTLKTTSYTLDTNWHHLAVTYTPGTNGWVFYADGVSSATTTSAATSSSLAYWYLGKSSFASDGKATGNFNQLAIFGRPLNVDEVNYLARYPNNPVNYTPTVSTQTISPYTYVNNYFPCFPAGYLLDANKSAYPIYCTMDNMANSMACPENYDDVWWVLPGFKFVVWVNSNFGGSSFTVDNTYGFNMMCKVSDYKNQASSVKVYYKGQLVKDGQVQPYTTGVNTATANNAFPSTMPFLYKVGAGAATGATASTTKAYPSFPGVWLNDSTAGIKPVFHSTADLSTLGMSAVDDGYIILPGFKVILYQSTNYTGTVTGTYDNTNGYNLYYVTLSTLNLTRSIRVYFHGVLLSNNTTNLGWTAAGSTAFTGTSVLGIAANPTTNNVYVVGNFTAAGGTACGSIALWNGTAFSAVGSGAFTGTRINKVVVDRNNNVYVAGLFTSIGGVAVSNVAKWDGTSWSPLTTGVNAECNCIAVDSNNNVYFGGDFTSAGGVANTTYLAKWDGTAWSALGTGLNGPCNGIAVDATNQLYFAGAFTTAGGSSSFRCGKWTGTAYNTTSFVAGLQGTNNTGNSVAIDSRGNVYFGGQFTSAGPNSVSARFIVKYVPSTNTWSSLGGGVSLAGFPVYFVTVDDYDNVYACGNLTTANTGTTTVNGIARWDGSAWYALGTGVTTSTSVYTMCAVKDTFLYVGGNFTAAGGVANTNLFARWDL